MYQIHGAEAMCQVPKLCINKLLLVVCMQLEVRNSYIISKARI